MKKAKLEKIACENCEKNGAKVCSFCGGFFCDDCSFTCGICDSIACPECVVFCEDCEDYLCKVHSTRFSCIHAFCPDHKSTFCTECEFLCECCDKPFPFYTKERCKLCGSSVTSTHIRKCGQCPKTGCPKCITEFGYCIHNHFHCAGCLPKKCYICERDICSTYYILRENSTPSILFYLHDWCYIECEWNVNEYSREKMDVY